MRVIILIISLILFVENLSAQIACGTSHESQQIIDQKKLAVIMKQITEKSLENDSVAITFHVVNNAVSEEFIRNEIILLNIYFRGANITFFACGSPRNIEGSNSYTNNGVDILNQQNHVFNTINVYYANLVQDNSGLICGYAFFPGLPDRDRYILINPNGVCLVNATTLAHEIGHYYDLLHTHSTFGGREFVDGSNCRTAGDGFCDTPADPNLLNDAVNNSCRYIGLERDPKGFLYQPDTRNMMSYGPSNCTNKFSLEQLARVRFTHETENNFLLDECNFFPDFEVLSESKLSTIRSDEKLFIEYTFENKGVQEDFEVPVFIYLSDDPDDRGFIIKKDTINFSAFEGQKFETFVVDLPLNSSSNKYFLTVLIDPDFDFLELQETNNLFTLEFTIDNTGLSDELIFPNPTFGEFKLFLRDPRLSNRFVVSIYDLEGRLRKRIEGFKNQDEYFTELDISEFRKGLYIIDVFFLTQERRKTFKVYKRI